jgi:D-sedoheptulose 7-phosphate isomerase
MRAVSDTREFVDRYLSEMAAIALASSRDDLARFIDTLFECWREGRTIYTCGNGGSAGTATHLAADLAKYTAHDDRPRMKALSLCENAPLVSAITNDLGFDRIFSFQLESLMQPGDALIAISVHGGAGRDRAGAWSTNLIAAVECARRRGGRVLAMSGFDGGPLKELADVCVVVPARSTPHVEAFHVAYHHLVVQRLRDRIGEAARD